MGLIKNKILNNGLNVEYWNIHNFKPIFKTGKVDVIITGYKDHQSRVDGVEHGAVENRTFELSDFAGNEVTREGVYSKLKESVMVEDFEHRQKNIMITDEGSGQLIEDPNYEPLMIETNFFADASPDEDHV